MFRASLQVASWALPFNFFFDAADGSLRDGELILSNVSCFKGPRDNPELNMSGFPPVPGWTTDIKIDYLYIKLKGTRSVEELIGELWNLIINYKKRMVELNGTDDSARPLVFERIVLSGMSGRLRKVPEAGSQQKEEKEEDKPLPNILVEHLELKNCKLVVEDPEKLANFDVDQKGEGHPPVIDIAEWDTRNLLLRKRLPALLLHTKCQGYGRLTLSPARSLFKALLKHHFDLRRSTYSQHVSTITDTLTIHHSERPALDPPRAV